MALLGRREALAFVYICAYNADVAFQWDAKKAESNVRKHGVAFSDAVGVFEDPYAVTIETMGLDFLGRVLVVCWTPRGDDIRIFSAREATRHERGDYEQGE